MIFFAFSERRGITAADVWWLLYQSNSETARDYIHHWFNWSQTASEEKKSVAEGQHRITFPGRLRPQCQDYGQASSDDISVFTFICQTQVWSQVWKLAVCAQKYIRSYSASQTSWPQCSMLAISDSKTETLPLRCKWAMKIQLGSCTYGVTQQWKWKCPALHRRTSFLTTPAPVTVWTETFPYSNFRANYRFHLKVRWNVVSYEISHVNGLLLRDDNK